MATMIFTKGEKVRHLDRPEWGLGRVLEDAANNEVRVHFNNAGEITLKLEFANLAKTAGDIFPARRVPEQFPRKAIADELNMLAQYFSKPEEATYSDLRYLVHHKESILEYLYWALESI